MPPPARGCPIGAGVYGTFCRSNIYQFRQFIKIKYGAGGVAYVFGGHGLHKRTVLRPRTDLAVRKQSFSHRQALCLPVVTADGQLPEKLFLRCLQPALGKKFGLKLCYFLIYRSHTFFKVGLVAAETDRGYSCVGELSVSALYAIYPSVLFPQDGVEYGIVCRTAQDVA